MSLSIPAFHVSDQSQVKGRAEVFIASRKDAVSSGTFKIEVSAQFNPATDDYPSGSMVLSIDMSDGAKGVVKATSVELMNSHGKHNPTVFMTGRCVGDLSGGATDVKGLRYWVMLANNRASTDSGGTPDIVGFALHDHNGNRVAYGTGPLRSGDISVAPK